MLVGAAFAGGPEALQRWYCLAAFAALCAYLVRPGTYLESGESVARLTGVFLCYLASVVSQSTLPSSAALCGQLVWLLFHVLVVFGPGTLEHV